MSKRLLNFFRGAIMRKPWGRGSVGRAMRSQRIGQGFESPRLHQSKPKTNHSQVKVVLGFFLFSFHCILFKVSRKRCQFQIKNSYKMALKLRSLPHREYGRIAKRFSGERPFSCALSFALFRLSIWRVLERRGAAEPLVYSSIHHSAEVLYQVYSRLLFL